MTHLGQYTKFHMDITLVYFNKIVYCPSNLQIYKIVVCTSFSTAHKQPPLPLSGATYQGP